LDESDKPHPHAVDEINSKSGKENRNPVGLTNMHGNVYEWCADRFDADYYKESPKENPKDPDKGSYRMFCGGGWRNVASRLSVSTAIPVTANVTWASASPGLFSRSIVHLPGRF
jgi:formylglycine-generating enzyme required for sulfatase activity